MGRHTRSQQLGTGGRISELAAPVLVVCLGIGLGLASGCGGGRDHSARKGCEATCRVLLECTFGSASRVPECTRECLDDLENRSSGCQEATTTLGTCASGRTCEDFADGVCADEFRAATDACNEMDAGMDVDGGEDGGMDAGPPDAGMDAGPPDAGTDAGTDAGMDAGMDAGPPDGGPPDAGPPDTGPPDAGPPPDGCSPRTCTAAGAECGVIDDGCGRVIGCGSCTTPETCGGGGVANRCGCTPTTCAAAGADCGSISNGCGATLSCGTCAAPDTCGGGGTTNRCGCTPTTCAAAGADCGSISNGCGATLSCGTCTAPDTCGGGGTTNRCGCTPTTCTAVGAECGSVSNGCGGTLSCGTCAAPALCMATTCTCPPPGSVGPNSPTSGGSLAGPGTVAWSGTANVVSQDSVAATAVLNNSGGPSRYLTAQGFGLAVPALATITGIEVTVRRRTSSGRLADAAVRLIRGGTVEATDRATAADWGTTWAAVTYGGASDLWGGAWTPAEVNAASFGVALAARHTGGGPDTAEVDHMTLTVHYTFVCP